MELRVGGRVELIFRHAELAALVEPTPDRFKQCEGGHLAHGRVTRCEPPRVLGITWDEESGSASEVIFELTARDADVLLVLTHRRLPDREAIVDIAGGWAHASRHPGRSSERPGAGTLLSTVARAEGEYDGRLPLDV